MIDIDWTFFFAEKDCPAIDIGYSDVIGATGVYGNNITVNCSQGFVKDDGHNNMTSYDITCDVTAQWSFIRNCTSKQRNIQ